LTEAYNLAIEAEKYIPNDAKLLALFTKCSINISVKTEPPGASLYIKDYKKSNDEWGLLGISPLENIKVPMGYFRWKFEKEGYETVFAAAITFAFDLTKKTQFVPNEVFRKLDKKGSIPPGMVRVPSTETGIGVFGDFFIDKYEVTNKQYKEFVNSSGYRNQKYWKHEFIKNGEPLTWEEAMQECVDKTGRFGPATWEAGDYPEGEDDYPVRGINWYEAAACAEYMGKTLPTSYHWTIASGYYTPLLQDRGFSEIHIPRSNFKVKGPATVGSHTGITSFGTYDMAGNVREWSWNETPKGRTIRGGAWDDPTYMFGKQDYLTTFER